MTLSEYLGLTLSEANVALVLESMTVEEQIALQARLSDGGTSAQELVDSYSDKYVGPQTTIAVDFNDKPKLEGYPIPEENKTPPLINVPLDSDDLPSINTGNDGGLVDVGKPVDDGGKSSLDKLADTTIVTYEPNKGAVGNMGEFLGQSGFGSDVKDNSSKTSKQYQGQSVYTANKPIGDIIKKGDQFYLDGQHKNHIEVFDKRGNFRAVLNLDGTVNEAKTKAAEGRKLK